MTRRPLTWPTVHELGHVLGLDHPGGCSDPSVMCLRGPAHWTFLGYSDVDIVVDDAVHDAAREDAEGWNDEHFLSAWKLPLGGEWSSASGAWGDPVGSLLAPAIATQGTGAPTDDYMVGWNQAGYSYTVIGDGSPGSWEGPIGHGRAPSFHSIAIAGGYGRWVVAWRERGGPIQNQTADVFRNIGVRTSPDGVTWLRPVLRELHVDAWASPTVAYHAPTQRFVVGWVHSGVEDMLPAVAARTERFPRFQTARYDGTVGSPSWSDVRAVWADEDEDGAVDPGEEMRPWDSFDIECDAVDCQVVYIESDNTRRLRSFRIDVDPENGSVFYVGGSRQESWDGDFQTGPFQASPALAISELGFRRVMALRPLLGNNDYNYPAFEQYTGTGGVLSIGELLSLRDSFDRCGFTYNSMRDEYMMVYVEGQQ